LGSNTCEGAYQGGGERAGAFSDAYASNENRGSEGEPVTGGRKVGTTQNEYRGGPEKGAIREKEGGISFTKKNEREDFDRKKTRGNKKVRD